MEKLIKDYQNINPQSLEDLWLCLAKSAENSMIQAGAKPNIDYTILDCYKLTQPMIAEEFRSNKLTFSGGK